MKSSWTSKPLLRALGMLVFFCLVPIAVAQDEKEETTKRVEKQEDKAADNKAKAEDMARALTLGKDLEIAMRLLRSYQPKDVHEHLAKSLLPDPLRQLLSGWAYHQQGDYEQASSHFDNVDPDQFHGDSYLTSRLTDLSKTAAELKSYEVLETANFSIRYKPGADKVLIYFLPDILERIYTKYSQLFQFSRDEKIIVELMPDHRLFSYASSLTRSQIETTGTIALCVENRLVMLTPRRVLTGYYWPDVIAHEFVHYILTKQSADRAPLWLQEGVAKYFEARWDREDANPLDPALETSLALALSEEGQLITVEQMMPSFAALPTAALARQAYAQTTAMVDYLSKHHGEDIIRKIVVGLKTDGDLDRVLGDEIGQDFTGFEASWGDWVKDQNYRIHGGQHAEGVKLLDEDGGEEQVVSLENPENDLARKHTRLGDLLLERNRYKAALRQYEKIPVAQSRMNRQILLRMIACHRNLGQYSHVISLIDAQVFDLESDPTMLVKKAEAYMASENGAEAKGLLERCIRINPFYPSVYKMLLNLSPGEDEATDYREIIEILKHPSAPPIGDRKS